MAKYVTLKIVFILPFIIISCDRPKINKINFDYDQFKTQKLAWESSNIQNYTYEYYSRGFTFQHVKVYVEDGIYNRSDSLENSWIREYKKSITDIYNEIEQKYLSENGRDISSSQEYLTKIDIKYDAIYNIMLCRLIH